MKTIVIIIVCLFFTSIAKSQSDEPIFTIAQDTIKINDKFIEPFFFVNETSTPYLFKVFPVKSKTEKYQYSIKLSNYKGSENDGGFFRIIEVFMNDATILRLRQSEGWNSLPWNVINQSKNEYFFLVPLTDETTALVFTGYPYDCEPTLVTIVVLHKNTAKLVFNRNILINKVIQDDKSFCLILHDTLIEYIGKNNANTTDIWKIWNENGILRFGGSYGTANKNFN